MPRMYELTKNLRALADSRGIKHTHGYITADGSRTNKANVTSLWPVDDDPSMSITFMEDDGELFCDDGLTVEQAFSCVLVAMAGGANEA